MITTKSKINFSNLSVPPIIPAVQGDTGRVIQFELNDFTVPAEATATYYVQKPSGEAVYNEATISGNNVFVELTAQSIIEVGENYGQVRILVDEEVVTSFDFILLVKVFRGIEAVQSETEMNIFDKAVEHAQETIASTVTEAEAAIEAAAQEAEEYIAQAIDPTLTIPDKAADAKVVGDLIAAQFDPTKQYEMDEPCLHDGKLYVSRSDMYSAPGEWVPGDWKQVIIGDNLQELTAATKNITEIIAAPWNGGGVVVISYEVGDYCTRNGQLWRCTVANESGTWIAADWQNVTVVDEITDLKEALTTVETTLTHKADKDGTVASAEQLLSDVGTEDKQPYLFRATPYDSTRVDEEVVGATVGWNQLVDDSSAVTGVYVGVTASMTNHKYTITGTASANTGTFVIADNVNLTNGHKYFFAGPTKYSSNPHTTVLRVYNSSGGVMWAVVSASNRLFQCNGATGSYRLYFFIYKDTVVDIEVTPQIIDLTAWFGSTIADYAYTLETATAGSGVAFIKALLPGGYIPYSAPTLKSVSGLSGHKFTGFNAWNEQWEVGSFNDSGNEQGSLADIRSKGYIPALPNTEYYIKCSSSVLIFGYDANKNVVKRLKYGPANSTFTTSDSSICFIRFATYGGTYGATYKNDICINLSDPAKNGTYEPYKETTYALDSDLTLRGILKMDSDHNVYADGDVAKADGTVTRKYGSRAYQSGDESLTDAITDGTTTVYKLTTPTTETADPFASPQNCTPGGTEEYVYGESGSGVPVGHNSKYQKNMRSELERVSDAVPVAPSVAGTYSLKATVTAQGVTYGWVAE